MSIRLMGIASWMMAALLAAGQPAAAKQRQVWPGPYPATVVKVIDGDTVRVVASVWPGIDVPVSVRIAGIDTPESRRPKCPEERAAGKKAAALVRELLSPGDRVRLRDVHGGKYAGRVVARLMLLTEQGEASLGQMLIDRHLALPYFGGRKADWCAILRQQAAQDKQDQEGAQ